MWRLYADEGKGVCFRVFSAFFKAAYNSGLLRDVPLPVNGDQRGRTAEQRPHALLAGLHTEGDG